MRPKNKGERGSVLIEGAFMMLPLVGILIGMTVVGLNIGVSVQASQVTRDLGSMYVRGINFNLSKNQEVAVRLAEGLGLQLSGGDGLIYLSKVTFVSRDTCTALGLSPCNQDKHVITQRIVIGNSALRPSSLGTPNSSLINSDGLVKDYKQESSAVATLPGLNLMDGEYAYVCESYFDVVRLSISGAPERGVHTIAVF
jgi:hypothetical protein